MWARLLAGGVVWLSAMALLAALLQWSGSEPPTVDPRRDGVSLLARSLNDLRPRQPSGGYTWTVTAATAALGELVVHVDAVNPTDARQIAERVIASVRSRYDEVLVYVGPVRLGTDPTIRRIEWTPTRGYLESAF